MLPSHFNGIYAARLLPAVEHTVLILAISPHHIFSLAFLSSP
jgi:hypothetical protein